MNLPTKSKVEQIRTWTIRNISMTLTSISVKQIKITLTNLLDKLSQYLIVLTIYLLLTSCKY